MIVLAWVLGSLLLGASLAVAVLYRRNKRLDHRVSEQERTISGLRGDRDYWMRQHDNVGRRYRLTSDGLQAIINMRTENMANIGQRMFNTAIGSLAAARRLPFVKS